MFYHLLDDGSAASTKLVTRRRHSSVITQSTIKTAMQRKAASLDEASSSPLPCKQPVVEISPLSDSKLESATTPTVVSVVFRRLSEIFWLAWSSVAIAGVFSSQLDLGSGLLLKLVHVQLTRSIWGDYLQTNSN